MRRIIEWFGVGGDPCSTIPELKTLRAYGQSPSDVALEWVDIAEAQDGYRVCSVDGWVNRDQIGGTCATGSPVCDPTVAPSCIDAGALVGSPGDLRYYQVKGLCGTIEGP